MEEIKRCSRCILPETFPKTTFNEQGGCNFCLTHKTTPVLGEAKLEEILDTKKGEVYDCVVPISGGKDSIYMLYYAVKILKLKAIAVNYDSGFQSDLAKENMENICKMLNVPLVVKKADYKNQIKMLKEVLHISEILGNFFQTCGNCETNIKTVAINVAKENKVPFILHGSSQFEEPGSHSFTGIKAFVKEILKAKRNIIRLTIPIIEYCFYSVRQRIQMKVPLRRRFWPIGIMSFPNKGIEVIHFFDYIEWDSINKVGFLKEKLGWKCPNNHEHRFDCLLHCFVNHHWLKNSGISADGFNFSTMIRENRMKREDALLKERIQGERLENAKNLNNAASISQLKKILQDIVLIKFRLILRYEKSKRNYTYPATKFLSG